MVSYGTNGRITLKLNKLIINKNNHFCIQLQGMEKICKPDKLSITFLHPNLSKLFNCSIFTYVNDSINEIPQSELGCPCSRYTCNLNTLASYLSFCFKKVFF